jgi:hypothetical protein
MQAETILDVRLDVDKLTASKNPQKEVSHIIGAKMAKRKRLR